MAIQVFHLTDGPPLGNAASPVIADVLLVDGISRELLRIVSSGVYAPVWSLDPEVGLFVTREALPQLQVSTPPLDRRLMSPEVSHRPSSSIDRLVSLMQTLKADPDRSLHDLKSVASNLGCPQLRSHASRVYEFLPQLDSLLYIAIERLEQTCIATLAAINSALPSPTSFISIAFFIDTLRERPVQALQLVDRLDIPTHDRQLIKSFILRGSPKAAEDMLRR